MPLPPSTYATSVPVTAHQINQDLYTYDGSYFGAQGVMFHSNRPLSVEAFYGINVVTVPSAGYGQFSQINTANTDGVAFSVVDNSALYGTGVDAPGAQARYSSNGVTTPGSSGSAAGGDNGRGGWVLFNHFMPLGPASGTSNAYGAAWYQQLVLRDDIGVIQPGSTTRQNCAFACDLINVDAGDNFGVGVFSADPAGQAKTVATNSQPNTSGITPRWLQLWCCVDTSFGSTVASIPSPQTTFTSSTPITSTLLNNTIQQTINLLNFPPSMINQQFLSAAVTANTITIAPFTNTPLLDNYSGFNTSTHQYIVPLNGIYFCHATIHVSSSFNSGEFQAGFTVNGTNYFGGSYNAVPFVTTTSSCAVTKVLDLHKGDTLSTFLNISGTTNFGNTHNSRILTVWMANINTATQSWTPPDVTGFAFTAGYPPGTASTQLVPLFNSKISNDLNFLLNRPYLLAYQTSAQSGLTVNTFSTITMNTVAGMIHNSLGDNYAGWSSANHNYVAPVAGWYLAVSEITAASRSTTTDSMVAAIYVPTSGGVTAPTTGSGPPDWYQHMLIAAGGAQPTGTTAIGCYYLLAGETIAPQGMVQASSGTWATDTSHNFDSHFEVIWVSN